MSEDQEEQNRRGFLADLADSVGEAVFTGLVGTVSTVVPVVTPDRPVRSQNRPTDQTTRVATNNVGTENSADSNTPESNHDDDYDIEIDNMNLPTGVLRTLIEAAYRALTPSETFGPNSDPSITDVIRLQKIAANCLAQQGCTFATSAACLIESKANYKTRTGEDLPTIEIKQPKEPDENDTNLKTAIAMYSIRRNNYLEKKHWNSECIAVITYAFPDQFATLEGAGGIIEESTTSRDYIKHLITIKKADFALKSDYMTVSNDVARLVYVPDATGGAGFFRTMEDLQVMSAAVSTTQDGLSDEHMIQAMIHAVNNGGHPCSGCTTDPRWMESKTQSR